MPSKTDAEERAERVGLFGGTFDPPHAGHVSVAADIAEALELDRVVWMPAGDPPHKPSGTDASAEDRLDMARAAVSADPRFEVESLEVERSGPSYTVDTLEQLRARSRKAELYLVIGVDQYRSFDRWRRPDRILELATLAVMDRDGDSARSVAVRSVERAPGRPVVFVPVRRVDVSSTEVRRALRDGRDVDGLVPDAVLAIIRERGLYGVEATVR